MAKTVKILSVLSIVFALVFFAVSVISGLARSRQDVFRWSVSVGEQWNWALSVIIPDAVFLIFLIAVNLYLLSGRRESASRSTEIVLILVQIVGFALFGLLFSWLEKIIWPQFSGFDFQFFISYFGNGYHLFDVFDFSSLFLLLSLAFSFAEKTLAAQQEPNPLS